MLSAEEIQKANQDSISAIKDRFIQDKPEGNEISKSQDAKDGFYITQDGLDKYKDDLFKSIDAGEIDEDGLEKSLDQISGLVKSTETIEGKETVVYRRV